MSIWNVVMLQHKMILCLFILFLLQGCQKQENEMKPPVANIKSHSFEIHGTIINDEYAWLRDNNWPEVKDRQIISYLEEENKFFDQFFLPLKNDKEKIFEELKGRIKLVDQSTYIKKNNYYYYSRVEAQKEYPIYCRKVGSTEAQEEILLDVNKLAEGKKFIKIDAFSVSPDHKFIAYSVDFTGDERYTIRVFNLETQEYLTDEIPQTIGSIVWHEELGGFFYTPTNENWRHDTVMFHYLGNEREKDRLIFHEPNPLYSASVSRSGSKQYIILSVSGLDDNVSYVISMHDHNFSPKLVKSRQDGIFYEMDHNGAFFYIKTNYKAKNFRIVKVSVDNFQESDWQEDYIKEESNKYLSSFDITENYVVLNYLIKAIPMIKIKSFGDGEEKIISFPDQAFNAEAMSTNYEEDDIRIIYSSLARPNTTYSYNFSSNQLAILKIQEIPSGFNPDEYMVERIFANNGEIEVPVTLLYKKSLFKKDGSNPVYLYGYGSYGISMPVSFRNSAISLVDRGFIYAISHVRGGDELGHSWYEDAKFLNKKRTFEDFIASAEKLIQDKYTSKGNIAICGGSAGGLLIGAVLNQKPELFKAAIAHVPFVDILNTMLDENLPLTPGEFKEWGNPKDPEYFEYIKSYSPYDNIKAQQYPNIFITAGLSDPRVGYWEAAKWAARLRAKKTDNNILLLKTNMDTGHSGASGRFDYLKEVAEELTFIFKIFGSKI